MPSHGLLGSLLLACGLALLNAETIFQFVENSPEHTILRGMLIRADIVTLLQGEEELTFFAPTDAAFEALTSSSIAADNIVAKIVEEPLQELWKPLLQELVKFHILKERLPPSDWPSSFTTRFSTHARLSESVYLNNCQQGCTTFSGDDYTPVVSFATNRLCWVSNSQV
eukprot:483883-Rhodomonas_salina.2